MAGLVVAVLALAVGSWEPPVDPLVGGLFFPVTLIVHGTIWTQAYPDAG